MKQEIPRLKAEFFKALAHPVRIRVLEALSDGEKSVTELREHVGTEQSYLSQQLGVLRRAGLVSTRREGSSVLYSLADPRAEEILSLSREMLLDILAASRNELRAS